MDNKKILPKVIIIALIIILCGILFRFLVADTKNYYAMVNSKQVVSTTSNVKYKYTIYSYDEDGNKKKLTFKTNKMIKNGTYLKLKVSFIRGVVKWEKLKYQKLPGNIKNKY